jgi:hypothetical protein
MLCLLSPTHVFLKGKVLLSSLLYLSILLSSHLIFTEMYNKCIQALYIPCCYFGFCVLSLLEKQGNTFSSSAVHVDSMNKEISYTGLVTLLRTSFAIESY